MQVTVQLSKKERLQSVRYLGGRPFKGVRRHRVLGRVLAVWCALAAVFLLLGALSGGRMQVAFGPDRQAQSEWMMLGSGLLLALVPVMALTSVIDHWLLYRARRNGAVYEEDEPQVFHFGRLGISVFQEGMARARVDYHAVVEVYRDRHFLLIRLDGRGVYILPLRCFGGEAQAQQAQQMVAGGMRLAKEQPAGTLAPEEQPCFWRATFTTDPMLASALAAVWYPQTQRRNRKDPLYWLSALAPALLLAAGSFAVARLGQLVFAGVLGGLAALYLPFALVVLLRNKLPANLQILPASACGESLVEIHEWGVRWCTRLCDVNTPYKHLRQLYMGDGFVLFCTKGLRLAAFAPLAALAGQDVQALADYVNGRIEEKRNENG